MSGLLPQMHLQERVEGGPNGERESQERESKGGTMHLLRETEREGEAAASQRWRGRETG
jgi:hypothetical protein